MRLRWRKRIWECRDDDCEVRTWTEQTPLAEPRRVLTARAGEWATDRVAALEGTPSSIARGFGVSWSTVWSAVERIGRARVDDADRVGPVTMVGFDETVMQPAQRRRRRRFVTAVVDVGTGQLLDVFEWRSVLPAASAGIDVLDDGANDENRRDDNRQPYAPRHSARSAVLDHCQLGGGTPAWRRSALSREPLAPTSLPPLTKPPMNLLSLRGIATCCVVVAEVSPARRAYLV